MDVLKRWLTPTDKLKPHGWRFACRDRNEAGKTQGIICSLDEEVFNYLGYMARKRETDCGSTLNPDCCGVVDIVQCELPICRKCLSSVISQQMGFWKSFTPIWKRFKAPICYAMTGHRVVHTSYNVSYDLLYGFHTPLTCDGLNRLRN